MKKYMTVLSVELISKEGVYIEFISDEYVKIHEYFKVSVDGNEYSFQAIKIKIEEDYLKITAIEVGYWRQKLDENSIDLRLVMGCEVIPINDQNEIQEIIKHSQWS